MRPLAFIFSLLLATTLFADWASATITPDVPENASARLTIELHPTLPQFRLHLTAKTDLPSVTWGYPDPIVITVTRADGTQFEDRTHSPAISTQQNSAHNNFASAPIDTRKWFSLPQGQTKSSDWFDYTRQLRALHRGTHASTKTLFSYGIYQIPNDKLFLPFAAYRIGSFVVLKKSAQDPQPTTLSLSTPLPLTRVQPIWDTYQNEINKELAAKTPVVTCRIQKSMTGYSLILTPIGEGAIIPLSQKASGKLSIRTADGAFHMRDKSLTISNNDRSPMTQPLEIGPMPISEALDPADFPNARALSITFHVDFEVPSGLRSQDCTAEIKL